MSNSHLQWGDIHTYFEVQLTAPGVTSYGAVWVGFPVLRQCFNDYLGWTQTTNNPAESDLYRLTLKDGGYVLDGQVQPFEAHTKSSRCEKPNGSLRDVPLDVRRSVHGPVVADRDGSTIAMRVAAIDRPRLFEQFWRMGLAHNLDEWQDAMRMQQLPLFNTAYADRDGHIAYVYNATLPVHPTGDYQFWQGVVPGDRSDLIATTIVPYDADPEGDRSADRLGAELQRHAVDVGVSDDARLDEVRRRLRRAAGHHAARAARHPHPEHRTGEDDVRGHQEVEAVDACRDRRSVRGRDCLDGKGDGHRPREAGGGRAREVGSRGRSRTATARCSSTSSCPPPARASPSIGGFKVPTDDRRPLETPRGFNDPAKAMATLDTVAGEVEKEYGSLHVKWGDVMRFRRGNADLPGNGAPSQLGAIRTIGVAPFVNGKAQQSRATRSTP